MTIVGEAWINVRAHTSEFKGDLARGTQPALEELEVESEAAGRRGGGNLGKGFTSGLKGLVGALTGIGLPLGAAGEGTAKLGQHMAETESRGKGLFGTMAGIGQSALLGVGAAAAIVGVESIKAAGAFDHATAAIAGGAGISSKAAKDIGDAFLSTAGKTEYSGTEMASAYAKVAGQLGLTEGHALSAKEALDVMSQAGELATATGMNLDAATSALGGVMQAYGLKAKQAADTTDILYNTARVTGTGVESVAGTFTKLHATLGAVTPSIGDVGSLMVDMAAHGETGRKALGAINSTLNGILAPSADVAKAQTALGVSFVDSSGHFVGMKGAIESLSPKLAGMSQDQQLATLKSIGFGSANKALLDTILAGPAGYEKASSAVEKLGAAHDSASKQAATLPNEMKTMKATMEDVFTVIGEKLIPVLTQMGKIVLGVVNFLMKHKEIAIALGIVIGGVLVAAIGAFTVSLFTAGGALAVVMGPIGLVILAVAGLVLAALYVKDHWKQIWDEVKKIAEDVWNFLTHVWGEIWHEITHIFGMIEGFFKQFWPFILGLFTGPLGLLIGLLIQHWSTIMNDIHKAWSAIANYFAQLPGKILKALEGFGKMLLGWITDAWDTLTGWVVTAVEAYIQFWVKLPGRILKALEAFGGLILGWITAAWNTVSGWVVTAFEDEVAFWTGLPDRILGALEGFGTKLLGWITDGWNMLTGFIVTAFEAEVTFWTGLPGKIVGALGDAGSTLLKWGGDLIGGLISGIGGAADSIGTAIWNAIKSGIHGIKGLVKGIPVIGGVLSDLIPFAAGGYVTKPTLGLIGEAGPEVVLPLNNPARMKQILGQAGQHGALSSLALSGSSSSHAANVTISPGAFVVHVHGAADPGVVGAATSAVNSGLSALTGALGRGRSPVRTGQR